MWRLVRHLHSVSTRMQEFDTLVSLEASPRGPPSDQFLLKDKKCSSQYALRRTEMTKITLFADCRFGRRFNSKFLSLNASNGPIKMATSLLDLQRVVAQSHQRILLPRFRGPVEHQTINVLH